MSRNDSKRRAKVLIVDDHPAVREALAMRIARQHDLEVCGEAAELSEALRLVTETQPDVAVVDISLKSGCGIDLIKRIKLRNDAICVLVWSTHSESLYAERALKAGRSVMSIRIKRRTRSSRAFGGVLEGKVYLSDAMVEAMLHRAVGAGRGEVTRSPLDALADRELEVFRLIGQGVKTAEIAETLHLSVKTVETYRDRIRAKLGLSDGTALAHYATSWMLENG